MRAISAILAGSLLLTAGAAPAAPRLTPEAKLAKALEGRVAGEPVNCINLRNVRGSRIIDGTAIVWEAGSTLYVSRPRGGAESLDDWDVLVTDTPSSQLCSIDVVKLHDRGTGMFTGFVTLGDFVPYRRVR